MLSYLLDAEKLLQILSCVNITATKIQFVWIEPGDLVERKETCQGRSRMTRLGFVCYLSRLSKCHAEFVFFCLSVCLHAVGPVGTRRQVGALQAKEYRINKPSEWFPFSCVFYLCVYHCMHACVRICMWGVHACVCIHACGVYMHVCVHACGVCMCLRTCMRVYVHACRVCMHMFVHACGVCMHVRTCMLGVHACGVCSIMWSGYVASTLHLSETRHPQPHQRQPKHQH